MSVHHAAECAGLIFIAWCAFIVWKAERASREPPMAISLHSRRTAERRARRALRLVQRTTVPDPDAKSIVAPDPVEQPRARVYHLQHWTAAHSRHLRAIRNHDEEALRS